MWLSYTTYVIDAFSVWNAVSWLILLTMLYGVWRLWRGMRLDAFERGLRELRERRSTTVSFPRRKPIPSRSGGWLQISLLPLMLVSCGAAMLLAQAQRPDDVSRPVTWALFVVVAAWYGTAKWPHLRGAGPLRNFALAGVLSGVGISALLWGFYLAVDSWWGEASYQRVTANFPSLLWWTAVGAAIGGLIGSFRASRIYAGARGGPPPASSELALTTTEELAIQSAPRTRKVAWGAIAVACGASLLFHLSAAPHLYREVDIRYWVWHWDTYHYPSNGLMLTMAPVTAQRQQADIATIDIPSSSSTDVLWVAADRQDVSAANESARPRQISGSPQERQLYRVPTPKRSIAAGERITSDMLTVAEYDDISAVFTNSRNVVGRIALRPLKAGEPIGVGQVIEGPFTASAVDTYREPVNQQVAVSGTLVNPGDMLDINSLAPIFDGPERVLIETEPLDTGLLTASTGQEIEQRVVDLPNVDLEDPRLIIDDIGLHVIQELNVVVDDAPVANASGRLSAAPPVKGPASGPVQVAVDPLVLNVPRYLPDPSGLARLSEQTVQPAQGSSPATQQKLPPRDRFRVTLQTKDGQSFTGRFVTWDRKSVSVEVGSTVMTFPLSFVDAVLSGGPESTVDFIARPLLSGGTPGGETSEPVPPGSLPLAPPTVRPVTRPTTPVPETQRVVPPATGDLKLDGAPLDPDRLPRAGVGGEQVKDTF